MTHYQLHRSGQRVGITAQATGHRFEVVGQALSGHFELCEDTLETAELRLELSSLSAGDRLKDHELRRFLDVPKEKEARAFLISPARLSRGQTGLSGRARFRFEIGARVTETEVALRGSGPNAHASLSLRFTQLGYKPPRLLLFSVRDELLVEVELSAEETSTAPV